MVVILAVSPAISFAQLSLLETPLPVDLGTSLTQLPPLPADLQNLLNLSPTIPLLTPVTPSQPVNDGSAEGSAAGVTLPADLGEISLNSATGVIGSEGGLIPDNGDTPQDESEATSVGAVDLARLTGPLAAFGIGSAASAAPPADGGEQNIFDFTLPGVGGVRIGVLKSISSATGTENAINLIIIQIEALDLNMAIPVMQSEATSEQTGRNIESTGTSDLIASAPGEPLVVGEGLLQGEDVAAVSVLNAGSTSTTDGSTAGSSNYWTLANVAIAGMPLAAVDDESGLAVAGTTLLPAPEGENSSFLAVEDPLLGLGGVYIGEKQSAGNGSTYASGAANVLRVDLLGIDELVVLGHAESSAGRAPATGGEKPGDSPNPGIGPGPTITPTPNPNPSPAPQPTISSSNGTTPDDSQGFSRAGRLPFTGTSLLLLAGWLGALALAVSHFMRKGRSRSAAV